jgi:hypothetical protein
MSEMTSLEEMQLPSTQDYIRDVKADLLDCLQRDQSDPKVLATLVLCVEDLHAELAMARRRRLQGSAEKIVEALAT